MRGDPAEAVVSDILAEAEVEVLETGDVPVEGCVEGRVGEVIAAGEVEAGQVGDAVHKLSEAFPQAEHLDFGDSSPN